MDATAIISEAGALPQNSLEDPRLSLDDPATWEALGLGGCTTKAGVRVTPRGALSYPPMWRAINLIAGDVGRMPLETFRRQSDDGKERAKEHPAFRLMRRQANPYVRASAFKRALTYHAMLFGNGCAAIFRDGRGFARELLILDPTETCLAAVEGELWYATMIAGEPRVLHASNVFHVKGLSHNGLWGLSVVDLMAEQLGLPIAAREYMARFFGQGSNQSGVLMVPGTFTDDKIKNTLRMWDEIATGMTRAHKVALLKDNVKFVPTSISPKDSDSTGLLEHEVRMVSAITGCPPHKLGDTSRTSHNSLEAENQSYVDDCLDPWLVEWEEEADAKLLTDREREADSHFHEFNRNSRLRTDSTARANLYHRLREMGVMSANDILRRENMPTIGPEGDLRFRPANWVPLGETPEAKPPRDEQRTRNAHRRLIADILDKRAEIEREKVLKAASKEDDFDAWTVSFYTEHQNHLIASLEGARRVVEAHHGRRLDVKWAESVMEFARARRAAAVAAVEGVAAGDRRPALEALNWSSQPLLRQLIRKATACRS